MAFNSGASGSTSAPAAGGFSFSSSSGSAPAAIFSFGTTTENSTASGPTAGSGSGFSFGAAPSGSNSGGFGAVTTTKSGGGGGKRGADGEKPTSFGATSTATGGFGGFSGAPPTAGGFGFSGSTPAPTATATAAGFSFGSASSALADSSPGAGDSAAPVQASGGFSFGAAAPADTAPAPAAGGFSFGAAAPADAAHAPVAGGFSFGAVVSKPSEAVLAPDAPAAGGFSFGAVDAAPAPGGFSFGAAPLADAAAKTLASKAPENNAAALSFVDTPDFKVADPKPATTAAPSLVGVSTTAAPAQATPARAKDPARLEYQTLTVEQILNKFQKELESDAVDYMKQAHRVMQYDAILRDSQRSLSHMTQQTSKLLVQQTELEQLLQGIGAFQTELDSNLTKMETQVDDLFRAQSHVTPVEADRKREQAYNTAVEVDGRLSILTTNLQSSLHALEGAQENIMTAEVGDVVRIMNMHQSQLEQLERATRTMDHDIKQLEQMMAATTST